MNAKPGILIVNADTLARRALHRDMLASGFNVSDAAHPEEAIALSRVIEFEIVLLNVPIDDLWLKTCRVLRAGIPNAVLIVMMPNNDPDRTAEILDAGADQCLAGTLLFPELLARLRATFRPLLNCENAARRAITIGEISLDPVRRQVSRAGIPVRLTPKEFDLLYFLMSHAGVPISHASLLKAGWGAEDFARVQYLRIFVRQLRMKLNDRIDPQYILTDNCIGYRFAEPERFLGPAPASIRESTPVTC